MSLQKTPLLVAVTGPDGSGKSTACEKVKELLEGSLGLGSVTEVAVWDSLKEASAPFQSKAAAAKYLADLDGMSRTLFIFHALSRALQLGKRSSSKILLLNGYWYKYAVSELGYGVDPQIVLGAIQGFPTPDLTFFLEVDPETALFRRQVASQYEQGAGEGFLQFQSRLAKEWTVLEQALATDKTWIHIPSNLTPDQVAQNIVQQVRDEIRRADASL